MFSASWLWIQCNQLLHALAALTSLSWQKIPWTMRWNRPFYKLLLLGAFVRESGKETKTVNAWFSYALTEDIDRVGWSETSIRSVSCYWHWIWDLEVWVGLQDYGKCFTIIQYLSKIGAWYGSNSYASSIHQWIYIPLSMHKLDDIPLLLKIRDTSLLTMSPNCYQAPPLPSRNPSVTEAFTLLIQAHKAVLWFWAEVSVPSRINLSDPMPTGTMSTSEPRI